MKILLVNLDSTIPNLALAKIAKYHTDKGDEVIWDMPIVKYDKAYVSCVFTKNKHLAMEWQGKAEIGGSGFDLQKTLPPEIEEVKPRINLGFTTRGCIRKCSFCIVPRKEGGIRIVGDLLDLWDGKSKNVVMLDNNILALPEHFALVCHQARENKIRIDFNQGLDHRLLTDDIAKVIKKAPMIENRFAYDHPSYKSTVQKAFDILDRNGITRSNWYVLVGYNTTPDEDLERLNFIKSQGNGHRAYVQRYETCKGNRFYIDLAGWACQRKFFVKKTFEQFVEAKRQRK